MPKDETEKVSCRTPTKGRDGVTNIPKWKYDVLRSAILDVIGRAGAEGIPFSDLKEAVRANLEAPTLGKVGSLGWHVTTVKLEMEVRAELCRVDAKGPQRIVLGWNS